MTMSKTDCIIEMLEGKFKYDYIQKQLKKLFGTGVSRSTISFIKKELGFGKEAEATVSQISAKIDLDSTESTVKSTNSKINFQNGNGNTIMSQEQARNIWQNAPLMRKQSIESKLLKSLYELKIGSTSGLKLALIKKRIGGLYS